MFMDNPDFRSWVADIRDDCRYRITGAVGDAVYQSITVYTSAGTLESSATSRRVRDDLTNADDGTFRVVLPRNHPGDGSDWMAMPDGAHPVAAGHPHPALPPQNH